MMQSASGTARATIESTAETARYRSVYLPVVRDATPRTLALFDFAEASMVVGKRESSSTPDQGLFFLNNRLVLDQSDAMAKRLMKAKSSRDERIAMAFRLAYARDATAKEMSAATDFMREFDPGSSAGRGQDAAVLKLSVLCQAIIASSEFHYLN